MFKPDDRVRCIDNLGMEKHLTVGNFYTIGPYVKSEHCCHIKEINGGAYAYRFVKLSDDMEDGLYV